MIPNQEEADNLIKIRMRVKFIGYFLLFTNSISIAYEFYNKNFDFTFIVSAILIIFVCLFLIIYIPKRIYDYNVILKRLLAIFITASFITQLGRTFFRQDFLYKLDIVIILFSILFGLIGYSICCKFLDNYLIGKNR